MNVAIMHSLSIIVTVAPTINDRIANKNAICFRTHMVVNCQLLSLTFVASTFPIVRDVWLDDMAGRHR